jgi:methyl-accepting chemotaxis protein
MRARIFVLVALCGIPAVIGSLVALAALSRVHGGVVRLDSRSVKPLAELGDLRDMEGDMRNNVWAYVAADAKTRAAIAQDTADTDHQADADIAAYFVANGSRTDTTGRLMRDFVARLAAWRQVRDAQVYATAAQGRPAQAYAALHADLATADDAMANPLDALYKAEVAEAATRLAAADNSYRNARLAVAGIIGAGLCVGSLAAWMLTAGMLRTVRAIRTVLASGDPQARVGMDDGSEIGALARALDAMLDDAAARRSAVHTDQQERENQLRGAHVRRQLAEQEVRRRAQTVVDDTARSVLDELSNVAAQAQAVRTAASTIESRVEAADEVTRAVVTQADTTDGVVRAVNDSLRRVGGIAHLIAGVAAQTNLLALNATIEAARAGEAGKGFAVVASEVKELAAATERSTSEISKTLATLESDAAAMAATIQGMSEGIGGLSAATGDLKQVAAEQQLTAEQLDRSVDEAIERIQSMASATDRLDRRGSARIPASGMVTVVTGGSSHQLRLLDIGEDGVRCLADARLGLGAGATAQLQLQVGSVTETSRITVVRRDPGPDGDELGIRFQDLTERGRTQIREYIRALLNETG